MPMKILVTGKNKRIIKDICERCSEDRGYITLKCKPDTNALFDAMYKEMPNVVFVCMSNETAEDVKIYDVLKEAVRVGNIHMLVVANNEDKRIFQKYTDVNKIAFFARPVSMFTVYGKLMEIEEKIDKNNYGAFELFERPEDEEESTRKRILVVDDDSVQLVAIKEMLKEFYDVTAVKSGVDCFKYLEKKTPDLILLDYMMPEMDGPAVLHELRKDESTANIPVVFLTGVTEKKTVIKTLTELKPQGYVVKPSKKSNLVAKIIDALEQN